MCWAVCHWCSAKCVETSTPPCPICLVIVMELLLIPAGAEATEVGSMSSTSGCGATEGVSHAKSLWQRLSEGKKSKRVNEDERQWKRWSGAELSGKNLAGWRRKVRMIKCLMLYTMWYTMLYIMVHSMTDHGICHTWYGIYHMYIMVYHMLYSMVYNIYIDVWACPSLTLPTTHSLTQEGSMPVSLKL
jgi:hypothetical protein